MPDIYDEHMISCDTCGDRFRYSCMNITGKRTKGGTFGLVPFAQHQQKIQSEFDFSY